MHDGANASAPLLAEIGAGGVVAGGEDFDALLDGLAIRSRSGNTLFVRLVAGGLSPGGRGFSASYTTLTCPSDGSCNGHGSCAFRNNRIRRRTHYLLVLGVVVMARKIIRFRPHP